VVKAKKKHIVTSKSGFKEQNGPVMQVGTSQDNIGPLEDIGQSHSRTQELGNHHCKF
jgi:hypothetical protein